MQNSDPAISSADTATSIEKKVISIEKKLILLTVAVVFCLVNLGTVSHSRSKRSYDGGWASYVDKQRSSAANRNLRRIFDKSQDDFTAAESLHMRDLIVNKSAPIEIEAAIETDPKANPSAENMSSDSATTSQPTTDEPTASPTKPETQSPTKNPTKAATDNPTASPTKPATHSATKNPTQPPTDDATASPTKPATRTATRNPTTARTFKPPTRQAKSSEHSPTKTTTDRQDVSLVTSFFADGILTLMNEDTAKASLDHLREISAAILKNIHNPYFAQVVVILDGAKEEANCSHFREYLVKLENSFLEWNHEHANITILGTDSSLQKLTCVNREQSQPNYFELFRYATNFNATESPIVTSPIVILENADMVFDETLYWAGLIKPNTILALPTNGFKNTPPDVKAYLQFAAHNFSNAVDWDTLKIPGRCRERSTSWDGYIFHQDYVRGTLVDPQVFQRPTKQDSTAFFKMNENGAEHAALWSLLQNMPNGTLAACGCSYVRTWHYHAAAKMHTSPKSRGFGWANKRDDVPKPWTHPLPPAPEKGDDAFVVDPKFINLRRIHTDLIASMKNVA